MKKMPRIGLFGAIGLGLIVLVVGVVIISDNLKTIDESKSIATRVINAQKEQADLNQRLMRAASDGDLLVVTDLVELGADINFSDSYGWTPLIQASMMNRLDVVKYLVVKGADVNAVAEDGTNPLQNAIIFDHVAMVKFLIARGANLKSKGKYGWDAVETATQRDRGKVLNYFRHEGLVPSSTSH